MAEARKEVTRFKFEAAPVRMIFGNLISAKASSYGGGRVSDPHFEIQAAIPPDHVELKALKGLIKKVAMAEFGSTDNLSLPIKDGTKLADKGQAKGKNREAFRGMVVLKASSSVAYPPALCYISGGEVLDVEDNMRSQAAGKFYPGVYVGMEITLKAYAGNDSNIPNSVVAYLSTVCSTGQGDKLGGSAASRYAGFAKNVGVVSDENPEDEGEDISL